MMNKLAMQICAALVSSSCIVSVGNASSAFSHDSDDSVPAIDLWAVLSGDNPSANFPGNTLLVSPGTHSIDLYYRARAYNKGGQEFEEVVYNYDIKLLASPGANLYGIKGGDATLGNICDDVNECTWRQLGGDNLGKKPSDGPTLAFTFDFSGNKGDFVEIKGSYLSPQIWDDLEFEPFRLVEVQAVPVPAAVWLFGSGLVMLTGVARRKSRAL